MLVSSTITLINRVSSLTYLEPAPVGPSISVCGANRGQPGEKRNQNSYNHVNEYVNHVYKGQRGLWVV